MLLAFALSLLVHTIILFTPEVEAPPDELSLPPLTARLDPLPKPTVQPAEKPKSKDPITSQDDDASLEPKASAMVAMEKSEDRTEIHALPKHIRLSFIAYQGEDGFMTGEIRHRLDIHRNKYTLRAVRKSAGLASLLNRDQLVQISRGKIVEQGLQPETFDMEMLTSGGKRKLHTSFDWPAQKLHSSLGNETFLPVDAQDMLSFMYQLSQISMKGELFTLPVSDGTQIEQYEIEIGGVREISTPLGQLRALYLRKLHTRRQPYFEIWLGLEYRLLPVKFRQFDGSNNVTEEFSISDIRATDE